MKCKKKKEKKAEAECRNCWDWMIWYHITSFLVMWQQSSKVPAACEGAERWICRGTRLKSASLRLSPCSFRFSRWHSTAHIMLHFAQPHQPKFHCLGSYVTNSREILDIISRPMRYANYPPGFTHPAQYSAIAAHTQRRSSHPCTSTAIRRHVCSHASAQTYQHAKPCHVHNTCWHFRKLVLSSGDRWTQRGDVLEDFPAVQREILCCSHQDTPSVAEDGSKHLRLINQP